MLDSHVVRFRFENGSPIPETLEQRELSPEAIVTHLDSFQGLTSLSALVEGATGCRGYVTVQQGETLLHVYVVDEVEILGGMPLRVEAFVSEKSIEGYVSTEAILNVLKELDKNEPIGKMLENYIVSE